MKIQDRLRSKAIFLELVLILFSLTFSQVGQAQSAWFGISLPPGIGNPHAATVDVSTVGPAPAVFAEDDLENSSMLKGSQIFPLVDQIVEFSRQSRREGNRIWGRVTGFRSAKATVDWSANNFREAGLLGVEVQEYSGEGEFWWPNDWEVRILGSESFGIGSRDVVLESSLVTAGSQINTGTLTAALIDTGYVNDAIPNISVIGKIAIQTLTPDTGAYSERTPTRERAQQLMAAGALAVLNVVEQTGNMHTRDFSNCNGPCFNIGTADGWFLKTVHEAAIDRGLENELKVQLSLDAEILQGLNGHNAVGIVRGNSEENIIINAHVDGWYDGAGDNADGLAVMIAMAKYFSLPVNKPDRTLVFVASGGHHSTGLNGPRSFVAMNPDLLSKTVLVLNLEHIAQFQIDSQNWAVGPNEQPMNYSITNAAPFLAELTRIGMERYGFNLNPEFSTSAPGDLGGYRSLGLPMIQAIHAGPMYHASGDVLETISIPGLERAARFYTYFVDQVAKASRSDIDPN